MCLIVILTAGRGLVRELVGDLLRLAHARAQESCLDLLHETSAAELDDGVRLGLARRALQVDDERVAFPGRAVVGRNELCDRLSQCLELLVDELLRNLGLGARHLERRPVDDLGGGLHLDRGRERPGLLLGRRQLEVVLGRGDGAQPRARRRRPEPATDVRLDRLDPDPVLADLRDEHRHRHLPLPEPGDLDRLREVVDCVLDRVLEVVRRHVHRQADAVLAELFHLSGHLGAIQADTGGPPAGVPVGPLRPTGVLPSPHAAWNRRVRCRVPRRARPGNGDPETPCDGLARRGLRSSRCSSCRRTSRWRASRSSRSSPSPGSSSTRCARPSGCCSAANHSGDGRRSVPLDFAAPRGCGGTGRRGGFRSRWASALGGSSPLARTSPHASRRPGQVPSLTTIMKTTIHSSTSSMREYRSTFAISCCARGVVPPGASRS